ncbi:hypothetical protein [Brevundimonas sp.]|uniref:hypothetical protein n=1 Tax=Brevundimonas sp. TaxID=1871086 RepID=UPI0025B9E880|nr:hypothetical protein [Brevundimonas sp.]
MKTTLFPILAAAAFLTACGNGDVNPPTEPAEPLRTPEAMQQVQPKGPSSLASRGPRSFVGVWAANLRWCDQPQGANSPYTITPLQFDSHDHSCEIASIRETGSGYAASLSCVENGQVRTERVHMATTGEVMNLTYVDQDMMTVKLVRCPSSPRAPDPGNPLEKMLKGKSDGETEPGVQPPEPSSPPQG